MIGELTPVTIGFAVMLTHGIGFTIGLSTSRIRIVTLGDATIFPVIGSMISRITFQSPIPNIDPGKIGSFHESDSLVTGFVACQL